MASLGDILYYTVEELEKALGETNLPHYVRKCEAAFMKRTAEIAYQVAWNTNIKAIFIAGPSSSGKTTFADRLSAALHMHGRPTCSLSLDDYYLDDLVPAIINGRPDLESLDTLDVELMMTQISALLAGETVNVPTFDFHSRKRIMQDHKILRVPPLGVLLVEGLHGLSSHISGQLPDDAYVSVLIMPYAKLVGDNSILESREIRVLRRICRDHNQRNTSALATLDYWPMLDYAEERSFPEYIANAHEFVNSAMGYEFCVIPALAAQLIEADLRDYEEGRLRTPSMAASANRHFDLEGAVAWSKQLLRICKRLPALAVEVVPPNSILNEFIR